MKPPTVGAAGCARAVRPVRVARAGASPLPPCAPGSPSRRLPRLQEVAPGTGPPAVWGGLGQAGSCQGEEESL